MTDIQLITHNNLEIRLLSESATLDETEVISSLFPEEKSLLDGMKSPKRRSEFVRRCHIFHKHYTNQPLARNEGGDPAWPEGFMGSITHKAGHVLVTCREKENSPWHCVGIDLESPQKVHEGLYAKICQEDEIALLDRMSSQIHSVNQLMTAVFAFKEAIYKAIYPVGKTFFYFHDARITEINTETGLIKAELLKKVSEWTPEGFICQGQFESLSIDQKDFVLASCLIKAS